MFEVSLSVYILGDKMKRKIICVKCSIAEKLADYVSLSIDFVYLSEANNKIILI